MKNYYTLFILAVILVFGFSSKAQSEWTGPPTTFSKAGNADWTLEANQDRITNNVWITRADNKGLFNIAQEASHQQNNGNGPSPVDTEWAFGNISDGVQNLTFTTWGVAHSDNGGGNPSSLVNQDMVVHLITDDIYIDIKLLSWGGSAQGAPFSYERSTNNLSTNDFQSAPDLKLYPNPSKNYVSIDGLTGPTKFKLYTILGTVIKSGTIQSGEELNLRDLSDGAYFFKLQNGTTLKFIKQ